MHAKEYVVSTFALVILLLFCSPIFALAIGMGWNVAPSAIGLKLFVGLTNTDVVNSLHSLLLPLVSAVIIFRSDYFVGIFGTLVLLILCAAIIVGFFVFMATNPAIFGDEPKFVPYINEYTAVHTSIFQMIGMLTVLFLAKLGLSAETTQPAEGTVAQEKMDDQRAGPLGDGVKAELEPVIEQKPAPARPAGAVTEGAIQ